MQHSQGGQTYYPNGTMLDMKGYNKILEFDPEKKRITVQSGVTWNDIQKKINPMALRYRSCSLKIFYCWRFIKCKCTRA